MKSIETENPRPKAKSKQSSTGNSSITTNAIIAKKKKDDKTKDTKEVKKVVPKKDDTLLKFYYHTRQTNCDERSDILDLKPGQQLKIYSWNVNGLRNVFDVAGINELQNFINDENPDILCIQETKVNRDLIVKKKLDTLLIDKYASFWNTNIKCPGFSGVVVFTKYKPVKVIYGIGKENHDEESRVITLEFQTFYLISVYVPNSGEVNINIYTYDIFYNIITIAILINTKS